MELLTFIMYDMLCFLIKIVLLLILFLFFKDKLADILLDKQFSKTFGKIDKSILDMNFDDDPDFVDTINIIDEEESQKSDSQTPTAF